MERVFIDTYGYDNDWIMGKIANDIYECAIAVGVPCRIGACKDYQGEEIVYHLDYHTAAPYTKAKHNSVFYTHLNNVLQEKILVDMKDKFDSFICMSPEDAQYLIELGFDACKVFGKILPVRNTYVKPVSIGIFSACYADGRKNEQWLVDFCHTNEKAKLVNFVFIGRGWGEVCKELENCGCTYEWHNVSRSLPYEYQFQQNKLADLNYYIYMGMDGGAMGTYDAYAQDVPLCVTFDGFHKAIKDLDYCFDDKESFMKQLSTVVQKHADRISFFSDNTPANYVDWLIKVWNGKISNAINKEDAKCISFDTVVEKKRTQYYKLNLSAIRTFLSWKKWQRKNERKHNG